MLWHAFTTVVILRENMRLSGMSPGDVAFCTCLANMRYKQCTKADIELLNSRVIGKGLHRNVLRQTKFWNVAVITGLNSYHDAFNRISSNQFARQTGSPLRTFYLDDLWSKTLLISTMTYAAEEMAKEKAARFQKYLWKLPPCLTQNILSQLTICLNMPVMLKHNDATELYATNGAEEVVVHWDENMNDHGLPVLETLFVELTNPPRDVQIPPLDKNVILIPTTSNDLKCILIGDRVVDITRTQVPVIPNFAMTNYCSQGCTCQSNVVELSRCRTHQSVYTVLSRCQSLEGTMILEDFSSCKITGGASGDLRRELHELDILDFLTEL